MAASDGFEEPRLIVSAASRDLRRQLGALTWVILEEVALAAVAEGGRLVARTSARQIADRLRVDPGTAAGALRTLRNRGLLRLEREQGPAGRFGLSIYVVAPVPGLTVVPPCVAAAKMVPSSMERPAVGDADRLPAVAEGRSFDRPSPAQPRTGEPYMGEPHVRESYIADAPSPSSLQCPGQESLDLGTTSL